MSSLKEAIHLCTREHINIRNTPKRVCIYAFGYMSHFEIQLAASWSALAQMRISNWEPQRKYRNITVWPNLASDRQTKKENKWLSDFRTTILHMSVQPFEGFAKKLGERSSTLPTSRNSLDAISHHVSSNCHFAPRDIMPFGTTWHHACQRLRKVVVLLVYTYVNALEWTPRFHNMARTAFGIVSGGTRMRRTAGSTRKDSTRSSQFSGFSLHQRKCSTAADCHGSTLLPSRYERTRKASKETGGYSQMFLQRIQSFFHKR